MKKELEGAIHATAKKIAELLEPRVRHIVAEMFRAAVAPPARRAAKRKPKATTEEQLAAALLTSPKAPKKKAPKAKKRGAYGAISNALLKYLAKAKAGAKVAEIADATKLAPSQVRIAANQLKRAGKVAFVGRGVYALAKKVTNSKANGKAAAAPEKKSKAKQAKKVAQQAAQKVARKAKAPAPAPAVQPAESVPAAG